ncbi:MAG TPA: hypothetical protein VMW66_00205 [Elusimicrobiales bacterium]|nr:hypothetical protein [Elusimicrobiales bacterium]
MKKEHTVRIRSFVRAHTVIAALLVCSFLVSHAETPKNLPRSAKNSAQRFEKGKIQLLDYAYKMLDYSLNRYSTKPKIPEDNNFAKEKYDSLYITLWDEGKNVAYKANAPKNSKYRIFHDIEYACAKIAGDLKKTSKNPQLVLDILFDKYKIPKEVYPSLKLNDAGLYRSELLKRLDYIFELGVDAVELTIGGKKPSAIFLPFHIIKNNYRLEDILTRLCTALETEENCYMNLSSDLYLYSVFSLTGKRGGEVYELLRYNTKIGVKEINPKLLAWRIQLAENWFFNHFNTSKGHLNYLYYPHIDEYADSNNHIRQLASLWMMAKIKNFNDQFKPKGIVNKIRYYIRQYKFGKFIKKTIKLYLENVYELPTYTYLKTDDKAVIANNAFIIMALCEFKNYPKWLELSKKFADAIVVNQKSDGEYNTYFESPSTSGKNYYPGEAMLALMKIYEITKDEKYLDSVKKAFGHYRDYWRKNKNTAFVPWHTQAYYLLYGYTQDKELADFIFEMNDWLTSNYQIKKSPYDDAVGGFAKNSKYPSSYSYVFMEGVLDAYKLALTIGDKKHIKLYQPTAAYGTRFVLQSQFTSENSFYFKNPPLVVGGFRSSVLNNTLRIDNVQHASAVLIKAYNLSK